MDFKEFNRRYRKDTVSFLLAMNLYLDYGATVLRAGSKEDLSGAAALEISKLFAGEKLDHIIETARMLAGLDPNDLIPYISRCGIRAGATGEENHHLVFDAHYNLREKNGYPIPRNYQK